MKQNLLLVNIQFYVSRRYRRFLKFATALLCCMFAMTVVSCDKDDDDEPKVSLKFNPNKAEVAVGSTVNVTGGTEPYTVTSSDVKIATVTVSKNTITIKGIKTGAATILVSDKNKASGKLSVTVKEGVTALDFDKKSAEVEVGKDARPAAQCLAHTDCIGMDNSQARNHRHSQIR